MASSKQPPFAGTPNPLRDWLNDHPVEIKKNIETLFSICKFEQTSEAAAAKNKIKCLINFTKISDQINDVEDFKTTFNKTLVGLFKQHNPFITIEIYNKICNAEQEFLPVNFSDEYKEILSDKLALILLGRIEQLLKANTLPSCDPTETKINNFIVALTILDYEWGRKTWGIEKNENFKQYLVDKYCTVVFREGVSNCTGDSITGQTPKDLKTIADQIHKYYIENILETVTPNGAALTPIETKMKDNIILKSKNIKTIYQNCVAYQSYLQANKLQEVTSHKNLALNLIHLQFESVWIINMDVISVKASDFLKENKKNTWIDYIYLFIYKSFVMKDDKTKNDSNSNAFNNLIQKYANNTYNNKISINTEKLDLEKAYYDELYNRTMLYTDTLYKDCPKNSGSGLIEIKIKP
jgi:hypothetical protein